MASIPQRHTYYGGEGVGSSDLRGMEGSRHRRRHVTFGPYILGSTLGEGEFGRVKLGWSKHLSNSPNEVPKQVAIKLVRRDTIPKNSEKEIKIYREINALKHLSHPNIVKLEEVLQNSKYIGIVLEYASGGEFYKYIQKKRRLKEGVACRLFVQLISGVHYMHAKGLVHRDLKLENLLLDKHENLVITDFGFVNEFFAHNELMKTSCGSPCYAAPELVVSSKPYEARKADIWSCGVILYAMLAGYLPWDDDPKNPDGNDIAKLYHYITRTPLKFPEYVTPLPRDLLRRILCPDPKKRITMRNIEKHEWVRPHLPFLSITPEEWDRTMLSNQVFRPPKMKSQHSSRPRSNCSTSSTGSKSDKRDSLVIDSALVNLPAPPQESQSHVITKPSPPSPELRRSPVRGTNRHSRSNSAASIALQAVVDAEREHNLQQEVYISLSKKNHSHKNRNTPAFIVQRSNTHSGTSGNASSLMNKDSTIVETSPAKGHTTEAKSNSNELHTLATSVNKDSQSFKSKTNHTTNQYHHFAAQHRKPRPTSYHPGSSASAAEASLPYQSMLASGESQNQLGSGSQFDSTPLLQIEPSSLAPSGNQSPRMISRKSFSASKPSLDLQSVSGDLIKSQNGTGGLTKGINDQPQETGNDEARRSRRYSGVIVEKMCSTVTEEKVDSKDNSTEGSKRTVMERKPDNRKRFSFLSFYSTYETSKSSLDTSESKTVSPPTITRKHSSSARQRTVNEQEDTKGNNSTASRQTRSSTKNYRQSVMIASIPESTPAAQPQNGQSTAKKVVDFFKRRSMRI
ncbi:hypothetical protein HG537_0F02160 [Torulaspora globosa]|uniref:non-specific serine/threonine protein kinase n=1 Tax=Torulaspora globosa TaxID=48254 RepID=A0A7H9HY30_9SACH|nr:hypothetical protein HG537_0F02160 [Torulaspora sp. CBS 2947]